MRFPTALTVLALFIAPLCSAEESERIAKLYEDASVVPDRLNADSPWLIGVHRYVVSTSQNYVVMVPGSESAPTRPETRVRDYEIENAISLARRFPQFKFYDTNGNMLTADQARLRIKKLKSFVYARGNKRIAPELLRPYASDILVVVDNENERNAAAFRH